MSYILDALRKSQQARQPGTAPRPGAVHNISLALPVSGWWLALGIVLLLGLVAGGLLLWRGTLARLPDPLPPVVNESVAEAVSGAGPTSAVPAVADKPASPQLPVGKTASVADLGEQARLPPAPPSPPAAKKPAVTRTVTKAPAVAIRSEPVKTASTAPAIPLPTDETPLLQQMPQDFQRALPPLAVTIHVYSHDESQRILFINNREYQQGSELAGGLRVEHIVPDGVVLSFRGERFKLSRPR